MVQQYERLGSGIRVTKSGNTKLTKPRFFVTLVPKSCQNYKREAYMQFSANNELLFWDVSSRMTNGPDVKLQDRRTITNPMVTHLFPLPASPQ